MKILEVNKYNFVKGGADRHFLDLTALLSRSGLQTAVFSVKDSRNLFSPWKKYFLSPVGYNRDDSNVFQKTKGIFRMFHSFEAAKKMGKLLDDFSPDIVHIHNIYHQISPSILPEIKKRGISVVMTVHDYKLISPDYLMTRESLAWKNLPDPKIWNFVKNKGFKNSYPKSFLASLEFAFHRKTGVYQKNIDRFIVPSLFLKKKLVAHGIEVGKISVLPHFVSFSGKPEKPDSCPLEKYAFYFGRVSRDKGVDRLVSVFEKNPEMKLYLAGKIEKGFPLPKCKNIKYLGFLGEEDIFRFARNAVFCVSFSSLPETFGLVALESLASGTPFIGLDGGAFREIVEDGRTGFICRNRKEAEQKMKLLFEDPGLRALLSRNCLDDRERFSPEKYLLEIREIFKKEIGLARKKNRKEGFFLKGKSRKFSTRLAGFLAKRKSA